MVMDTPQKHLRKCHFFYRIPGFNSECYEIASGDPESEVPFIPGKIESTCSVCGRKHGNRRIR